jgi:elongator complex protein 2
MDEYFLSVAKDQTTRFHAKWSKTGTWHEFGRPQIHGYDMQSIAFLNRCTFVSGADEKLARIFEAPKLVLKNYYNVSNDATVLDLIVSLVSFETGQFVRFFLKAPYHVHFIEQFKVG